MKKNVSYKTNEEIWLEVDRFRLVKGVEPYSSIPVDSMAIAELVFRLTPAPFPGLFDNYHQDAAITPDLKDLLVDEKTYNEYEGGDQWWENRLRFSVAHELGHLFMHRTEIHANAFTDMRDFKAWMGDRSKPVTPEYQADEFAGRLLVPREPLIEWYDRYRETASGNDPNWWQQDGVRTKLAKKIAPRFGIHHKAIETRFDREGIWPQEK